jgi:hypothetical protein
MKQAELSDLKGHVERLVKESAVANDVQGVEIGADVDEYGDHFLIVRLKTAKPDNLRWARISSLVRNIEDEVALLDDRFPSVRLAEAA